MWTLQASALLPLLLHAVGILYAADLIYLDLGTRGTACCMVPDGLGNVYVVGSASSESGTTISVTKLDAANRVIGSFRFGGSADEPRAAALDPTGNLVVAGQTRSSDFPLVHPLITQTEPGAPAGFIAKVNPSNGEILFSTLIGGVAAEPFVRLGTVVNAVTTDSGGNVYAAGTTNASDFPVSANAFQKTGAGGDTFGPRPFGFVLKISRDGGLVYSTLLGGLTANCFGGSHCVGINASTTSQAIAVDRNGVATVAGATNAPDFPTTAGAVQTICHCLERANNGFVTQLNAAGSGLVWSTFLGGTWYGFSQFPFGVNSISTLALDPAGNVTVAGRTDADDFPTTAGAFQPKLAGPPTTAQRPTDGFISRLNTNGTALVFSTYLGGSAADQVDDLQLDAASNVWLTGLTDSSDFPGTPAPFTGSFFVELSSNGARLLASQRAPSGAAGQAIVAGAEIRVLGPTGSVIQAPGGLVSGVAVLGFANSAGGPVKGLVAPGEFVSLYGNLLGPDPGVGATLDSQGRIASQLAGTRVLFDGIPAPLLYASSGQINALVPYGITGSSVVVQVTSLAGNVPGVNLNFRAAQPEVFNSAGAALALNQNGSINSAENPAAPRSIVTIFASGAGLSFNQQPDGSIASGPVSRPIQPVAVLFNDLSLEILYAGNAPGLVSNTLQVNVRLPQQSGAGEFQLMVGGFFSNRFTIFSQ